MPQVLLQDAFWSIYNFKRERHEFRTEFELQISEGKIYAFYIFLPRLLPECDDSSAFILIYARAFQNSSFLIQYRKLLLITTHIPSDIFSPTARSRLNEYAALFPQSSFSRSLSLFLVRSPISRIHSVISSVGDKAYPASSDKSSKVGEEAKMSLLSSFT